VIKLKQTLTRCVSLLGLSFAPDAAMAQASASTQADPPRVVISYADLDIDSAAGLARLKSRIRRAAAQVCQPRGDQALWQRWGRLQCYRKTSARAEVQVAQRLAHEGSLASRSIVIVSEE
jgi:UrcA family protein